MDALLGEVISIDRENRQMVVAIDKNGNSSKNAAASDTKQVSVHYGSQSLPAFVRPGAMVRLWGEYTANDPVVFNSESICRGARGRENDPTGVRSRLKQGCGRRGNGMGMGRHRGGGRP